MTVTRNQVIVPLLIQIGPKPKSTCCKITSNLIQTQIHDFDASTLEIFNPMRSFDNIHQDSFFHIDSFGVDELEKSPSL
jgi:Ni,Fe-hydrogenase I large subunit